MARFRDAGILVAVALLSGLVGAAASNMTASYLRADDTRSAEATVDVHVRPVTAEHHRSETSVVAASGPRPDAGASRQRAVAEVDPLSLSVEEQRARAEAFNQELLDRFAREPRHPTWSDESEAVLTSEIGALQARARLRLDGVTCHTESCIANVTWPDYAAAREEFPLLLHTHYSVNCVRHILLNEPGDATLTYRAQFIVTCADDYM